MAKISRATTHTAMPSALSMAWCSICRALSRVGNSHAFSNIRKIVCFIFFLGELVNGELHPVLSLAGLTNYIYIIYNIYIVSQNGFANSTLQQWFALYIDSGVRSVTDSNNT